MVLESGDNEELVRWLLERGTNPNAPFGAGRYGMTNFM
jgi:hypothetical protein